MRERERGLGGGVRGWVSAWVGYRKTENLQREPPGP